MFDFNSKTYPIGLDISDTNIKAAQLKKSGKKIKIQAISRIDLPVGVVQGGEIMKKEIFSKSLFNLLSKPVYGGFSGSDAVFCIPENKSYLELVPIERSPNQLTDMIEAEMEKYFPLPVEEMHYDWQIIEENASNYNVLIGGSSKKTVNSYIEALTEAKISILAAEIESISIARSLLAEEGSGKKDVNKNYAIINIGALRTNLIIYSKNTIVLSVSLPISGDEISSKIAKSLEIRPDQAEKAKIVCGLDKNIAKGIIRNILNEMIDNLIFKIREGLNFYDNKFQERGPINEVILCGGGANIIGIDELMSDALKLPVRKGDVFINMNSENTAEISKKLNTTHKIDAQEFQVAKQESSITQSDILSYAAPIGLALRNAISDK